MEHTLVPTRRCPRCGVHKPATAEHFDLGARGRLSTHCLPCLRHAQPGIIGGARRPVTSGSRAIDRRAYDDLFAMQGGVCGCCGRPERLLDDSGHPQRLEFYAHSGGRRALICFTCDLSCIGVGHDATRAARLAVFLGSGETIVTVAHLHQEEPAVIEVTPEPEKE